MHTSRILSIGLAIPLALAASLTLSGCNPLDLIRGSAPGADSGQSPAPTPESGADEAPVELSRAEAAERYLQIVCQPNDAWDAWDAAWVELDAAVQAGGSPEITAVTETAGEILRLRQQETALFGDPRIIWPASVQEPIGVLRNLNLNDLRLLEREANASTLDELYSITYPELTPEQERAPQEIRLQLGLDADTVASCRGYERDNDRLYAELQRYLDANGSGNSGNS